MNIVVATVPVGSGPVAVAIRPNGAFAYVTNQSSDDVSVIDTATNTVVATATVPVVSGPPTAAPMLWPLRGAAPLPTWQIPPRAPSP